eukprot:CAMPEP_0172479290 /NCGR_PEP_ID=MMETSP1066-20121228/3831_1 /TAXON_ID=671091 /ORGANISM="Coscinodiscus wailesii, Strain CCMP2513" /LENGTH=334 /DNA_ID=CAMNT_0013239659 /DNA_START=284 /DNA_END=1285 /DNA_ORIENTATION=+
MAVGDNCGQSTELVFDLGAVHTANELTYKYCSIPGFSDAAVKDFEFGPGESGASASYVLSGTIPEDKGSEYGKALKYSFEDTSSRYWTFHGMNNNGNGSYIWICDIELRYEVKSIAHPNPSISAIIATNSDNCACISYNDITLTDKSMCASRNIHSLATDSSLQNDITEGTCGQSTKLVLDLGAVYKANELIYKYCSLPGFSNGSVKDFEFGPGDSDANTSYVLTGIIPEDKGSAYGQEIKFSFEDISSQYWTFHGISNHGNRDYMWICGFELRYKPPRNGISYYMLDAGSAEQCPEGKEIPQEKCWEATLDIGSLEFGNKFNKAVNGLNIGDW